MQQRTTGKYCILAIAYIYRSVQRIFDLCLNQTRRFSGKHYTSILPINRTTQIQIWRIFFEYLKKLNAGKYGEDEEETDDIDINEVSNNPIYDEILNGVITDLEVYEAIQNLKKTTKLPVQTRY